MARQAKYTAVARQLHRRITGGAYGAGEPLPPEVQLAKEFSINRLTLRKALDVLEKDRLVIRRHGCGTFANPPRDEHALTTMLYIGDTHAHFYSNFYQALAAEAQDRGNVITSILPDSERQLSQLVKLAREHRQVICQDKHWASIRDLLGEDVRVTRVSGFDSIPKIDPADRAHYAVSTDTNQAVDLAVHHLVGLGHRRIAFLDASFEAGMREVRPLRSGQVLYQAYRCAILRSGLDYELGLGVPDPVQRPGPDTAFQEWHEQLLTAWLNEQHELPTAFVCAADFRAAPLLRALRGKRLSVPEEMSVVGIGNTPWAEWLDAPLTSVCLGETDMARLALLLNQEPEPPISRIVRVEPHLIIRKTTCSPRHQEETS